jgi:hypothetical protein
MVVLTVVGHRGIVPPLSGAETDGPAESRRILTRAPGDLKPLPDATVDWF